MIDLRCLEMNLSEIVRLILTQKKKVWSVDKVVHTHTSCKVPLRRKFSYLMVLLFHTFAASFSIKIVLVSK
jgi:hypothetical protein